MSLSVRFAALNVVPRFIAGMMRFKGLHFRWFESSWLRLYRLVASRERRCRRCSARKDDTV